ncbi:cation channel sperm-associated auxiliary subunit TMEM249 [Chrysemys picta bellii]|uniref:cation channel sperm-associated auxiliary subunit TMEM249 n=1 Tax=Chrysemys picta bellii TaxID=8478 RepID=UPI0032B15AF5
MADTGPLSVWADAHLPGAAMLRGAFVLWNLTFFDVERSLARRLQQNTHYPFQVQQPNVFVMEYYKDTLWKGALIFLLCVLGGVFYLKSEKVGEPLAGPRPCPTAPRQPRVLTPAGPQGLLLPQPGSQDQQVPLARLPPPGSGSWLPGPSLQVSQDYSGFFVYGILVGFWLFLSSMHKRHLVINHARGCYQIYIKRRLWEEGPLHQIYVRLMAQTDAYGKRFYSLIINGHGLEVLTLASLSDQYEHMEFLGRRIARKLKLNYFDYLDVSTRHVIRHRPPLERDEELQV